MRQAGLNGVKQLLIAYWLREELDRATFHGLHRHRNIAVPSDKDDWESSTCRCKLSLEFKSALPRQQVIDITETIYASAIRPTFPNVSGRIRESSKLRARIIAIFRNQ